MKPEDVLAYFGSQYALTKKTGMSGASLANWLRQGFVPEGSQYKLERLTQGALKARIEDVIKKPRKKKTYTKFTEGQKVFLCDKIDEWHTSIKKRIFFYTPNDEKTMDIGKEELKAIILAG